MSERGLGTQGQRRPVFLYPHFYLKRERALSWATSDGSSII